MKKIKLFYSVLVWALVFISGAHAVQQPSHFKLDSYQQILQQNKQQSFLMVLWSIDCAPCMKELKVLGEFHQQYPQHKLVLVSTDSMSQSNEITQLIAQYGLKNVNQWVFDDSFQHLRYSIDPGWYGELPRSYFYKQDHSRLAVSGKLHQQQLIQFFAQDIKNSGLKTL